jgi:hypothetical protein
LANAIENYTAFAFARAFLVSRLFGVYGLVFGVWKINSNNKMSINR